MADVAQATVEVQMQCAHCGSADVSCDAWAAWDVANQCWTLKTAFDQTFCHACECERRLVEMPL